MRLLVVVDMQEDFVRGVLTVPGAEEIIPGRRLMNLPVRNIMCFISMFDMEVNIMMR